MSAPKLCALGEQFCYDHDIELVMKEKSWFSLTGDSFAVKDHRGRTHFKIDPVMMTLKDKRQLKDGDGNVVATLKESGKKWEIYQGDSTNPHKMAADVKSEWLDSNDSTVTIYGEHKTKLELEGDYKSKNWKVKKEVFGFDPVLAIIRTESAHGGSKDTQTYYVWVDAGVDVALIIALVLVLDESYNEKE